MTSGTALCRRAVFMPAGRLVYPGPVEEALSRYRESYETVAQTASVAQRRPGTGELRTSDVRSSDVVYSCTEEKVIEIDVPANEQSVGTYFVSCHINDANGVLITKCDSRLVEAWFDPELDQRIRLTVGGLWFAPGRYLVDVFLCRAGILDAWEGATSFEVLPELPYPESMNDEAISGSLVLSDFTFERSHA